MQTLQMLLAASCIFEPSMPLLNAHKVLPDMQGPVYQAIEWLDHEGMDLIELHGPVAWVHTYMRVLHNLA